MDYQEFIERKRVADPPTGFDPSGINDQLFPFQRDIVRWACRRGRAAIFADCGLGKTPMQLEWARLVSEKTSGPVLILAPLAVSRQTKREGEKFSVPVTICRTQDDVRDGVNITNYEMLEHFSPETFAGVVLDESSILKAYGGKTCNVILDSFKALPYKLACTATPSPNDHMELGNHAEFVGAMTRGEMLSMFFVHDGGETSKWRIKGHAEDKFWEWVASWAIMLRKPSDLGYDDDKFLLPKLTVSHTQVLDSAPTPGMLFKMEARTLEERREARKGSLEERVAAVAVLANASDEQWLIWCNLNTEPVAGELDYWAGDDTFKSNGRLSIDLWQRYASPVWMDINPSRTLQKESAREEKDERHICPLQLDVIERACQLWSNHNDLVLSPFAGIGSEGFVAVKMGRRFVGVELKRSYFEQAVKNLGRAKHEQGTLL